MAFSKHIPDWIPGFTSDGTSITIPIASIPGLTSAHVNDTTGDIRKFLYHLLKKVCGVWNGLDAASLPGKMTLSNTYSTDKADNTTEVIQARFVTSTSGREVVDEV